MPFDDLNESTIVEMTEDSSEESDIIIDKANSKFDLKIKEALHINWGKANLNALQNHFVLTLSL